MTKITLYNVVSYITGLTLSTIGSIMLIVVLWNTWPIIVDSNDTFAALEAYLWTKELDFVYGVRLKLMEVTILGTAILILGIFTTVISRQVFRRGKYTLLQCPFCKNRWKAERARAWAKCPYCNKFIQPKTVRT